MVSVTRAATVMMVLVPKDPYKQLYMARLIFAVKLAKEEAENRKLRAKLADPYEQLDMAGLIFAVKLAEEEAETRKLRAKLAEKDFVITELQGRFVDVITKLQGHVVDAESTLLETTSLLSSVLDEYSKLSNEKNILVNTVKKLNGDVATSETFKRTLVQSLQDNGDDHKAASAGDSYGHPSSLSSVIAASNAAASTESKKYNSNGSDTWWSSIRASIVKQDDTSPALQESNEVKLGEIDTPVRKQQQQQLNPSAPPQSPAQSTRPQQPSPAPAPALTPTPAPVESSRWQSAGSPERPPAAERPPPVESKLTVPLSLPSSRSTTAPNPAPNANSTRTPPVDGKEFFRQARNRLSYEQFSSFLAIIKELNAHRQTREETLTIIKELNAHRQTREETLRKADKTFGRENKDLYVAFDGLLSRHLST